MKKNRMEPVNPEKPFKTSQLNRLGAALLLSSVFLASCSPSMKKSGETYSQALKEEYRGFSGESRGMSENMTADSVFIVKYDTVSREKVVLKYYGIAKTKTDTLTKVQTIENTKTDTIFLERKTMEKAEESTFWGRLRTLAIGALLALVILGAARFIRGAK